MLYDPKWEAKTKTTPLAGFIAWLEEQPADGAYNVYNADRCALGRWSQSRGESTITSLRDASARFGFDVLSVVAPEPRTFGAALKRARAALAATA